MLELKGYLTTGLVFLVMALISNIAFGKISYKGKSSEVKNDFQSACLYVKQIVLNNLNIIKAMVISLGCALFSHIIPLKQEISFIMVDISSTLFFFLCALLFIPREESAKRGFPLEIFGFIYSLIFMFYNAGSILFDMFCETEFFFSDMWIYGYSITIFTYTVCIAALRRFLERDVSIGATFFIGMMMLITLEFVTYYGIGYFGCLKWYNPSDYIDNMFGNIVGIINQGVFLATQTQKPGEATSEILGYIILNGTDILTGTIVLGYLMQKLINMSDRSKS